MKCEKCEPDELRQKCNRCGNKILGIAKKDIKAGEIIRSIVLIDGCLISDKINFRETITLGDLLNKEALG